MSKAEDGMIQPPVPGEVPPLQRVRLRDIIFGDELTERVQVEYFAHEKSFKNRLQLYFIKNRRSSFRIRLFNVFIKLLTCILYIIEATYPPLAELDDPYCPGCTESTNITDNMKMDREAYLENPIVHYRLLLWVKRPFWLWCTQTIAATFSLSETILVMYISYKGNILQLFMSIYFWLELFTSGLFIISILVFPLRIMFIPVFLNCWLAKDALQTMLNDLNRALLKNHSAMAQQIYILAVTIVCVLFTGTCGMQHLQRAGRREMDLFQSFYFIVVTFSTVGYGEFHPDYWMSQLFVIFMILIALSVIPAQVEKLMHVVAERKKGGGQYSKQRARAEKHVVVCLPFMRSDVIMDFLNEFYAHPRLQNYYVLLLSPSEIGNKTSILLQVPQWEERVIYMKGSALKDQDLERARIEDAEACFILSARNTIDKRNADQQTILRSWAVKDFAPKCPQYVQIFRPESKMHVKHAEYVVCEDEFKYALLANNCISHGISTFITLLLHTSRGEEGQHSSEPWHNLYGKHSGNEIYHIRLQNSKFFGEYEGKSFTYASFHAHRKYGVSLVAVKKDMPGSTIQLNPGPRHIMKTSDVCYYMSITKEELSTFVEPQNSSRERRESRVANTIAGIGTMALELQHARTQPAGQLIAAQPDVAKKIKSKHGSMKLKELQAENKPLLEVTSIRRKPSIAPVPDMVQPSQTNSSEESDEESTELAESQSCGICGLMCVEQQYIKGFPPVTPYIGTSATLCHLLKQKQTLCCLRLANTCDHSLNRTAFDYQWPTPAVIVAADVASNGLYNFIIPLRAHFRPVHELHPIVLLLETQPSIAFLDAVAWFPMIYWMNGSIECLDDLLRAGINMADHVVVANRELLNPGMEEYLVDCNSIVAVQTMYRLFPCVRIITELSHSTNMRFMQFNAKDLYALHQSKFEKKEKERGSHISYMFRLPFAAGTVFSANMLDTLLYQAFVKDYLIQFVRLLLGIDQAVGSGYLTSMKISENDMWIRTYGRLYQKLCSTESDIPIGIFRTQKMDSSAVSTQVSLEIEQQMAEKESSEDDVFQRRFSCKYLVSERHEIGNLVRCRMDNLNLNSDDYNFKSDPRGMISYVIINPSSDMKLEPNDIVYVIRPSQSLLRASRSFTPQRRLRRYRFSSHRASEVSSKASRSEPEQLNQKVDTSTPESTPKKNPAPAPLLEQDSQHSIPTVTVTS